MFTFKPFIHVYPFDISNFHILCWSGNSVLTEDFQ